MPRSVTHFKIAAIHCLPKPIYARPHSYALAFCRSFSSMAVDIQGKPITPTKEFKLSKPFLEKYKYAVPPFGFNGLGEIVYRRTYSRLKDDGEREQW